jgi:hypothetical protein
MLQKFGVKETKGKGTTYQERLAHPSILFGLILHHVR